MRKFLFLTILFLSAIAYCKAQSWEKYYGTNKMEEASDIIITSDNSYLVVANAGDAIYDRKNLYIIKTDTSGNIKWSKYLNYGVNNYFRIIESTDHFYYFSSNGLIIKATENGDIVWSRRYTGAEIASSSLTFDASGNIVGVGKKSVITYSNITGNVISTKTFFKGDFNYILKNSAGGYIIGGSEYTATNYNAIDAYFICLNSNLDSLWAQNIACSTSAIKINQIVERNNQYLIAASGCASFGGNNCWYSNSNFFALSSSGQVLEKFMTGSGYSSFESIAIKDDGSLMGYGYYGSSYPANLQFYDIDTVANTLVYPSAKTRFDIGLGKKIIALGNNRFLAVATTKSMGHGITDIAILKFGLNLITNTNTISGMIILDISKNCTTPSSNYLSNEIVVAHSPSTGHIYTKTDAFGKYYFALPDGSYTINHVPSKYKYLNCPVAGHNVTLSPATPSFSNLHFYDTTFIPTSSPFLKVDISSSARKRPCFKSSYTISYNNLGSQTATNVSLSVNIDPSIIPLTATKSYVKNGNNYTFSLGNLSGKSSGTITMIDSVACIPALTGQTKCANVKISYDTLYPLPTISWDKSSVEVYGFCDGNDSVRFVIKNKGQDMSTQSQYRLYESDGLRGNNSFQLQHNDSIVVSIFANGATYRLEADQNSGHPSYSSPSTVVEACGIDIVEFPSGYVNSRPHDDERYTYDEICSVIVNSYDPNEKSVLPQGITDNHYIKDNMRLKYHIDFQNTGSDTAYTVVLVDTLSNFLDPSKIIMGAASHPFEWELSGNGIITFVFNNINLVDSTTNEEKSHGYITFEIDQKTGNPLGTIITNNCAIFFDYNEPIITNEVFNTIDNNANPPIPTPPQRIVASVTLTSLGENKVKVYPNPAKEIVVFEVNNHSIGSFNFVIRDITGKELIKKENITGNRYQVSGNDLHAGMYIYSIYDSNGEIAQGKIVVSE